MEKLCDDSNTDIQYELGKILTAIVTLRESDSSILFAVDSEVREEGGLCLRKDKFLSLPNNKLGWSYGGNVGEVTFGFNDWLKNKGDALSWQNIIQEGGTVFANINQRLRSLAQISTGRVQGNDTAECLLAGFLEKPDILELNNSGKISSYWASGFHAIGVGKIFAYSIYETLNRITEYTPQQKIETIMDITTDIADGCCKPYNIYRITPSN